VTKAPSRSSIYKKTYKQSNHAALVLVVTTVSQPASSGIVQCAHVPEQLLQQHADRPTTSPRENTADFKERSQTS
jgi:hypothetical protein